MYFQGYLSKGLSLVEDDDEATTVVDTVVEGDVLLEESLFLFEVWDELSRPSKGQRSQRCSSEPHS